MVRKALFHSVILTSFLCVYTTLGQEYSSEPSTCVQCMNAKTCRAPDCFCCRDELTRLPISAKDIPQIVFFTFDDALTDSATKFYHRLFNESRTNPNGCPISMTLFVSHHDTVYRNVNHMYRKGMEIAAHSVSHAHMSNENFLQEAQNQKRNLATLGGVPENEIVGWRSPFLEPVGDMQPESLKKLGYTYDATLTYSKRTLKEKSPTPFTLDFGWPYDCKVKPCPKRRHFGFWEVPVVSLLDYLHKYDCVYVDGCNNPPPDEISAYNFLMDNFNSYYSQYRVPFGINMHPSWFYIPERLNAMDRFIKKLSQMDDVFVVSVKKMLDWLRSPTGLSQIKSFKPWQCPKTEETSHFGHGNKHSHNKNRRKPDPISQRKSYIQARLEQIRAMRRHSQHKFSHNQKRLQQAHEARQKWWSKPTQKPKVRPPTQKPKVRPQKPTKPAPIAPWVHKKHDRPVKQNARIPAIITPSPAREVPFWKRQNKAKQTPVKRNREDAWWEKAIPQAKTTKAKSKKKAPIVVEKPVFRENKPTKGPRITFNTKTKKISEVELNEQMNDGKTRKAKKDPRITFNTKKNSEVQLKEQMNDGKTRKAKKGPRITFNTKINSEVDLNEQMNNGKTMKAIETPIKPKAPPKVDFQKQLKAQEIKQLEIIENQKRLQKEQLRLQIEKLKENNKKVFKKQQEEEAKRRNDIEKKHVMELNKQKSIKGTKGQGQILKTEKKQNPPPQTFKFITTTSIPQSEKKSLFSHRSRKLDPWTRFVHFIIRNKP